MSGINQRSSDPGPNQSQMSPDGGPVSSNSPGLNGLASATTGGPGVNANAESAATSLSNLFRRPLKAPANLRSRGL